MNNHQPGDRAMRVAYRIMRRAGIGRAAARSECCAMRARIAQRSAQQIQLAVTDGLFM